MTIRFAPLAAVVLATLSVPAFAAEDPTSGGPTAAATAAAAVEKAPPARKRFCLNTRLSAEGEARKVCKTYAEWQRQGIDPRGK